MENNDLALIEDGISNMKIKNYDLAEQNFNSAIELQGPNLHRANYYMGVLYHLHLNRMDDAITFYKKATFLKPDYGHAWNNLGDVLCHFNQYDEAKTALSKAIHEMPSEILPRINLSYAQNRLGEHTQALKLLDEVLNIPDLDNDLLAKAHSEFGLALIHTNHAQEAYQHFKKAFQLDETDYQACYNIAFISDAFKNYEEALSFYDKAIALNGNESKGYQGKACTFIHTGNHHEALPLINKAIELNPTNFEGYYNLACICAGLKKKQKLFDAIQKTLELAPPQINIAAHILNDSDFASYRENQDFINLLTQ